MLHCFVVSSSLVHLLVHVCTKLSDWTCFHYPARCNSERTGAASASDCVATLCNTVTPEPCGQLSRGSSNEHSGYRVIGTCCSLTTAHCVLPCPEFEAPFACVCLFSSLTGNRARHMASVAAPGSNSLIHSLRPHEVRAICWRAELFWTKGCGHFCQRDFGLELIRLQSTHGWTDWRKTQPAIWSSIKARSRDAVLV